MKLPPRLLLAIVAGALTAGCADAPTGTPSASAPTVAPLLSAAPGQGIPDQYIVVFNATVADPPAAARELVRAHGGSLRHSWRHALRGFAATLSAPAVEALRRDPRVKYVQQDGKVFPAGTQTYPIWSLDRIDQRPQPPNDTYTWGADGSGVWVYVLDTGIRYDHDEFRGRAVKGYDAVAPGGTAADCHGHGTHVAGTVGGRTYGVARGVTLASVRVLACTDSGSVSDVVEGVDWVTANHKTPAVANLSLNAGVSWPLDEAIANSIGAGVTYVVAAGNQNADACSFSPARVSAALTVGATRYGDSRWATTSIQGSNYGSCVDLFAPGKGIASAGISSPTAVAFMTGTSMAAPHVAGVAALYLQHNNLAKPSTVVNVVLNAATTGVLTGIGSGSPNRLVYSHVVLLSVTLSCSGGECYAFASGGSGAGYSFSWQGAAETYDQGGESHATMRSNCLLGSITVRATATDSQGATDTETMTFSCQ